MGGAQDTDRYRRRLRAGLLSLGAALLLCGCAAAARSGAAAPSAPAPTPTAAVSPAPTPTPTPDLRQDADKIRVAELMCRNKATLRDEDGDFSDWIELENFSDQPVELEGWSLADRPDRKGWVLPARTLGPGERLLLYADRKDRRGEVLHTDFALSPGEQLYLYDSHGTSVSQVLCGERADVSRSLREDGSWQDCYFPTPGLPNDNRSYDSWQSGLTLEGPLAIWEVVVDNPVVNYVDLVGHSDWVELRNVSQQAVNLRDFCLSDDSDQLDLFRLPAQVLQPGELAVIRCTKEPSGGRAPLCDTFALDGGEEQLYLSRTDGSLVDYAALRGIPSGASYGRRAGAAGWFYFTEPIPLRENEGGSRRVSTAPTVTEPDGVFEDVRAVTVSLEGAGTIYYTLDGTLPTAASERYTGPLRLEETCVLRAVSREAGALPSRAATYTYIINEGHSLPVVSLVSDDKLTFNTMYYYGNKDVETPAELAFYGPEGQFHIPCGVKMHGGTSLELDKKNMSLRFRSKYGQERLRYDLFGGGQYEFTNLLLRAGQDYYDAIVRNELCLNLALSASSRVMSQRSRYTVLYVDGKYYGIYALMEKCNEQFYADLYGYSRESVTVVDGDSTLGTDFYEQVLSYPLEHNMAKDSNYRHFCELMDVDSLIDWVLLEGYCANGDLTFGNLRYCHSTEGDGRWRLMFYDLDAAFREEGLNFANLLSDEQRDIKQISQVMDALLQNASFKDRLLRRAAELLNGPLRDEIVIAELDRLVAQVEPEVERDYLNQELDPAEWPRHVKSLRSFLTGWREHSIDSLCRVLDLSRAERMKYFG